MSSLLKHTSRFYAIRYASIMATGDRRTLDNLKFVNGALRSLPIDSIKENYVRSVQGACFSCVSPTPIKNPMLVASSQSALKLLDLLPSDVAQDKFLEYFSGNKIMPGSEPAAHCYCGHQFGHFSGQLGDGCAILLGEIENTQGEQWEIQLKGSGKTPYSRTADGRKVLRSSIREFLCSEAMHHLGIPTTRAGSCITSDDYVDRDIFYNGNIIQERATVISRIAPSFIRFGSFEIFKPRDLVTGRVGPSVGLTDILHQLVDYVTENFYPEIHSAHSGDHVARTTAFFHEVCQRTARLVALWQCVGFCHGVLNTDNMSILGITIDYGPFGFLDRYDPGHVCNGSDDRGRYAYDGQPAICRWNLRKLAEALAPIGLTEEMIKEGLKLYDAEYDSAYLNKMRLKLGLLQKQLPEDIDLIESLLETMQKTGCDFTNGFQCLSLMPIPSTDIRKDVEDKVVERLLDQCSTPEELVKSFKPMMKLDQLEMLATQPPQLLAALGCPLDVIQTEIQKHREMEKLKKLPVQEKLAEDRSTWQSWLASYRQRLKLEAVDVSNGKSNEEINLERQKTMNSNNPRFILRNHIAQKAVEMAEQGDYSEINKVLKMLETPYDTDLLLENAFKGSQSEKRLFIESTPPLEESAPSTSHMVEEKWKVDENFSASYFNKPPIQALGISVT